MRYARHIIILIFCLGLFLSCSVDELESETTSTEVQDVRADGGDDETNPPDKDKGGG